MSDYSASGAVPIDDAVVEDPPTVDEVIRRQQEQYPDQAVTSMMNAGLTEEERAALVAGDVVEADSGEGPHIQERNENHP